MPGWGKRGAEGRMLLARRGGQQTGWPRIAGKDNGMPSESLHRRDEGEGNDGSCSGRRGRWLGGTPAKRSGKLRSASLRWRDDVLLGLALALGGGARGLAECAGGPLGLSQS